MAAPLILHVEDNPSNRKVVQHIFRTVDYRLVEAVDGEEGLRLARQELPDLVLLDMQLPRLSGYEVARALKADERTRHIPILAVTSYALAGDDLRAREAGCDGYLTKPFRPRQLLDYLEALLT
ncbi:MAG: response regulator [Gemmatimonadota bacterium]